MSDVVFLWQVLKAATNIALLFQRNRFLDVTDDNEERPWDQAYVTRDAMNIVSHEFTVFLVFSMLL